MNKNSFPIATALAVLIGLSSVSLAAQDPQTSEANGHEQRSADATKLELGPHKGALREVAGLNIETVVSSSGLRVYLFTSSGQPIGAERGRGVASLSVQGSAKRYRYDLFPAEDGSLSVAVDLSKIAGRQVTVGYQLVGITQKTVAFTDVAVVPIDQAQQDVLAIARQKVCPVSGKPLGSMGKPIAVDADGQRLFVCCAGCVDVVKANPTKYATSRPEVKLAVMNEDDAALITKQANCPVMDEPLGSMGQPIKLLVGGKPVYLCCKGCIKKVQAEPEKYVSMVYGNAVTVEKGTEEVRPGVFRVTAADQPFISAQKRCPVMDEPLEAMGGPYKVNASGKAVYICCPGCAKAIAAEPRKWLTELASQGVNPPTLR